MTSFLPYLWCNCQYYLICICRKRLDVVWVLYLFQFKVVGTLFIYDGWVVMVYEWSFWRFTETTYLICLALELLSQAINNYIYLNKIIRVLSVPYLDKWHFCISSPLVHQRNWNKPFLNFWLSICLLVTLDEQFFLLFKR